MSKDKYFSKEYPILFLFRLLNKYEITNGIISKKGIYVGMRTIKKDLNIHSNRLHYSLDFLENKRIIKVLRHKRKLIIKINNKILKMIVK